MDDILNYVFQDNHGFYGIVNIKENIVFPAHYDEYVIIDSETIELTKYEDYFFETTYVNLKYINEDVSYHVVESFEKETVTTGTLTYGKDYDNVKIYFNRFFLLSIYKEDKLCLTIVDMLDKEKVLVNKICKEFYIMPYEEELTDDNFIIKFVHNDDVVEYFSPFYNEYVDIQNQRKK